VTVTESELMVASGSSGGLGEGLEDGGPDGETEVVGGEAEAVGGLEVDALGEDPVAVAPHLGDDGVGGAGGGVLEEVGAEASQAVEDGEDQTREVPCSRRRGLTS
jgi:hypothetical protein